MNQPLSAASSHQLRDASWARFREAVDEARDAITAHRLFQPRVGIILGSGLSELAGHVQHASKLAYADIPYFPATHAAGHAGQLIMGYLAGMPVVVMSGRGHCYEGRCQNEVRFPVYCLQALGIDTLIVTNAAGGVNPRFRKEDLMLIDSHIDCLWRRQMPPCDWPATEQISEFYDPGLLELATRIALKQQCVLHRGCYLATLGPTYETRAEYRMFRQFGADAVGMSTVPEVLAARSAGVRVLACSVITNVASTWTPQVTTHGEVVAAGLGAGPRLLRLAMAMLEEMSGQPD